MDNAKKYEVIISDTAKHMLVSHSVFLANVSLDAADRLIEDFYQTALSLREFPNRCPWFSGESIPAFHFRYIMFGGRYCLLYKIEENKVYVDYCLDCRQDYAWLLQ